MPARTLFGAFMLLLAGCGTKSTPELIGDHDRLRTSWEQTARFAAGEWAERKVPVSFATRTLERTREELSSDEKALDKDSLPSSDRRRLTDALEGARTFSDTLLSSIRDNDRGSVRRLVQAYGRPSVDSLTRAVGLR